MLCVLSRFDCVLSFSLYSFVMIYAANIARGCQKVPRHSATGCWQNAHFLRQGQRPASRMGKRNDSRCVGATLHRRRYVAANAIYLRNGLKYAIVNLFVTFAYHSLESKCYNIFRYSLIFLFLYSIICRSIKIYFRQS